MTELEAAKIRIKQLEAEIEDLKALNLNKKEVLWKIAAQLRRVKMDPEHYPGRGLDYRPAPGPEVPL